MSVKMSCELKTRIRTGQVMLGFLSTICYFMYYFPPWPARVKYIRWYLSIHTVRGRFATSNKGRERMRTRQTRIINFVRIQYKLILVCSFSDWEGESEREVGFWRSTVLSPLELFSYHSRDRSDCLDPYNISPYFLTLHLHSTIHPFSQRWAYKKSLRNRTRSSPVARREPNTGRELRQVVAVVTRIIWY